jgi:hypothetical protein
MLLKKRFAFVSRASKNIGGAIDGTTGTSRRTRRKSRVASLSVIFATGAICLPLLASTTSAVAASPRTAPPIGKQLAELKGSVPRGEFATSDSTAVVGAAVPAVAYLTVSGRLNGVAAISASNAWAVGGTGLFASTSMSLIAHWNGIAWKREPTSAPARSILNGVAATSASNVWAVGSTGSGKTLILHWNGTSWKPVPSPSPGTYASLASVAATSARNAWAVGNAGPFKTLILHWNGTVWKQVPSPNPEIGNYERFLTGVAVTSVSNAWAVGGIGCGCGPATALILHWNGKRWIARKWQPYMGSGLRGMSAFSARSVWIVGGAGEGDGPMSTWILHWNGTSLKQMPSPSPGDRSMGGGAWLASVAVTSAHSAWAVGGYAIASGSRTLILHWNGTAWK